MTKTKIRHHKRTDEPLLIPRSTAMYHGECDVDENGYPITYEVGNTPTSLNVKRNLAAIPSRLRRRLKSSYRNEWNKG